MAFRRPSAAYGTASAPAAHGVIRSWSGSALQPRDAAASALASSRAATTSASAA
jgi:hypothetical protein